MPGERVMPECPTAVIVAKPKRQSWALEEAWDLAVLASPGGRAETTRFPGVILVYTPDRDPYRFSIVAARGERGFIQRIVPAQRCLIMPGRTEVLEALTSILSNVKSSSVRVVESLRGESKKVVGSGVALEALRHLGLAASRTSSTILAVEGVDSIVVASVGTTRRCGVGCTLVYLKR